jgi:hypothetical protein
MLPQAMAAYDFDYSRFYQPGYKPKIADMGASEGVQIEFGEVQLSFLQ